MTSPDAAQAAANRAELLYRSGQYLCSEAVLTLIRQSAATPTGVATAESASRTKICARSENTLPLGFHGGQALSWKPRPVCPATVRPHPGIAGLGLIVANEYLGGPMPDEMVRLASGFPVGMGMAGCVCGALSGGIMALGLKLGRSTPGTETPGLFAASKELHDRFTARRNSSCCRVLIRNLDFGSPRHLDQCATITGEVAADVIEILHRIEREEAARQRPDETSP